MRYLIAVLSTALYTNVQQTCSDNDKQHVQTGSYTKEQVKSYLIS